MTARQLADELRRLALINDFGHAIESIDSTEDDVVVTLTEKPTELQRIGIETLIAHGRCLGDIKVTVSADNVVFKPVAFDSDHGRIGTGVER